MMRKASWLSTKGFWLLIIKNYNHKSSIDNQIDLFMHFLAMSRNGQVVTDGGNGQVFF